MYSSAIFIASFAVFVFSSAPLVTTGDSGELVAAAFTLGIPHPPGYPLYVMMGKAFSFLPFGNVAYRMNLMSGVLVALSAVMIYRTACVIMDKEKSTAAAAIAAAWAFTGVSWSQATYSEVYPLQIFISLSAVYSVTRAVKSADFRYALLASFLTGMSLAGHYAGIIFIPAVLFYALYTDRIYWSVARVIHVLISFVLGLTPFLYLYVRAKAGPPINWGDPDNFERFMAHVIRASYGDVGATAASLFGGGAMQAAGLLCIAVIAALLFLGRKKYRVPWHRLAAWAVFILSAGTAAYVSVKGLTPEKTSYFIETIRSGGLAVAVPLSLAGMWAALRRDRGVFFFLVILLTVAASITLYRIPVTWSFNFLSLSDKFFLSLGSVLFLTAAVGAVYIAGLFSIAGIRPIYAGYAFLVLPLYLVGVNYSAMDQSRNYVANDFSTALMDTLEPGSIFIVYSDNHVFLTAYKKYVEMARPDVDVFTLTDSPFPHGRALSRARADMRRPVYSSTDQINGVVLEPAGILNRFPSPYAGPPPDSWGYYNIRVDESRLKYSSFEIREILAEYYFTQARRMMLEGDRQEMMRFLEKSAETGWDVMWVNVSVAGLFMEYGYMEKAHGLLLHALDVAPLNPEAHLELGRFYMLVGKPGEAEAVLASAVALKPGLSEAYLMLADIREKRGDYMGAVSALEEYLASGTGVDTAMAEDRITRLSAMLDKRE